MCTDINFLQFLPNILWIIIYSSPERGRERANKEVRGAASCLLIPDVSAHKKIPVFSVEQQLAHVWDRAM